MSKHIAQHRDPWPHVLAVVRPALILGDHDLIAGLRRSLSAQGVVQAVAARDTPALFGWMVGLFQLQGISDANAVGFTAKHGAVRWTDIATTLEASPACPRLRSYWHFEGCRFRKAAATCAEPRLLPRCSLPRFPLRNGRLSQNAVSLFLFLRDICDGDFVGWLDNRLQRARMAEGDIGSRTLQNALLGPLRSIYGVADKVLSMTLADLLLGADPDRDLWVRAGAGMIAIDSLVHNFLHRTGILRRFGADHAYGPGCYATGGCAAIIEGLAKRIDAREFNNGYPAVFPRFVQQSIWRFCAADVRNICNGNRIDHRAPCDQRLCPNYRRCDRLPLAPRLTSQTAGRAI